MRLVMLDPEGISFVEIFGSNARIKSFETTDLQSQKETRAYLTDLTGGGRLAARVVFKRP